jgi:hypothetical protein
MRSLVTANFGQEDAYSELEKELNAIPETDSYIQKLDDEDLAPTEDADDLYEFLEKTNDKIKILDHPDFQRAALVLGIGSVVTWEAAKGIFGGAGKLFTFAALVGGGAWAYKRYGSTRQ